MSTSVSLSHETESDPPPVEQAEKVAAPSAPAPRRAPPLMKFLRDKLPDSNMCAPLSVLCGAFRLRLALRPRRLGFPHRFALVALWSMARRVLHCGAESAVSCYPIMWYLNIMPDESGLRRRGVLAGLCAFVGIYKFDDVLLAVDFELSIDSFDVSSYGFR